MSLLCSIALFIRINPLSYVQCTELPRLVSYGIIKLESLLTTISEEDESLLSHGRDVSFFPINLLNMNNATDDHNFKQCKHVSFNTRTINMFPIITDINTYIRDLIFYGPLIQDCRTSGSMWFLPIADQQEFLITEMIENGDFEIDAFQELYIWNNKSQFLYEVRCVLRKCTLMLPKNTPSPINTLSQLSTDIPFPQTTLHDHFVRVGYVTEKFKYNLTRHGKETMEGLDESSALLAESLSYVQDKLKFTATFHQTNTWADLNANGSWAGMAKLLYLNKIDLAHSPTALLEVRLKIFKFLVISYPIELGVYYHKPLETNSADILRYGINQSIAIGLLGYLVLVTVLVVLIAGNNVPESGFFAITTITLQAPPLNKKYENASDILEFVVSAFGLIFNTIVSAFLIAKLFSGKAGFSNLDDLLRNNYAFSVENDSHLISANFSGAIPPLSEMGKVFSTMILEPLIPNGLGMEDILQQKNRAHLTLYNLFRNTNLSREILCSKVDYMFLQGHDVLLSSFTLKNSSLYQYINFARSQMWERGVRYRTLNARLRSTREVFPACETAASVTAVQIIDVLYHYFLLLASTFVAIFCMALEVLIDFYN